MNFWYVDTEKLPSCFLCIWWCFDKIIISFSYILVYVPAWNLFVILNISVLWEGIPLVVME